MRPLLKSPLVRFLAFSLVIHAAVLSDWKQREREETDAGTILNAELVAIAPEPVSVSATPAPGAQQKPPAAAAPTPVAPDPAPKPAAAATTARLSDLAPAPNPQAAQAEMFADDEMPATPEAPVAAESAPEPVAAESSSEPVAGESTSKPAVAESSSKPAVAESSSEPVAAEQEVAVPAKPMQPVRDLPLSGSQSYEVFFGKARFHIGRTLQSWTIDKESYRLSSSSETTGLAGLFRPYQLDYVAEGRIDAAGFHPESFSVRRGRNGARQYAAHFDWSAKEVTLGPLAAPRKMALPEGTLDVLSLIYQLMRAELAPGRFQLHVTTGNRLERHTLEVGVEEEIEVPAGTIRALPVRQIRKHGEESMEIWLAPERQYLPVRIRFLDKNGELSGEQLAADIAFHAR